MRVVGTAGHVDHGKSTLVQALTGINPDRLQEEQDREMTIDLGFAWLTLPHGETISLVDVPGHEAFIKNMLAGAGGMDAALVVIAADEGIMPQTREHLAILDLLKIRGGVVALTKTDMSFDSGWVELVQSEIRTALEGTALADAEIIPVSARTKQGLQELQLALERALEHVAEKADHNRPRLPVDRVFTMSGFGTVVTGTLSDGSFRVGDDVEIAPRGLRSRIRGLQAHKLGVEVAQAGGRTAVNLANVATDELARGDVLVRPDTYTATTMLDAQVEWLASAPKPLTHSQEVEFFLHTSQELARVRLLEGDTLAQGKRGWAQLILAAPVIAAQGDRFILRYPSPSITVGGGVIVSPHPTARHHRNRAQVLEKLERALQGTPADLVSQYVEAHPAIDAQEIGAGIGLDGETTQSALAELTNAGELAALSVERTVLYITRGVWNRWLERLTNELTAYHNQYPMRGGVPRKEVASRLKINPRAFDALVAEAVERGLVRAGDKQIALAGHAIVFDAATQARVDALLARFADAPYNPPSLPEAEQALGADTLYALIEQNKLERVAPTILMAPAAVKQMQTWVVETLKTQPEITAAQLRDQFGTSRKYAIAFLEYLDARHITRRVGDARVLR